MTKQKLTWKQRKEKLIGQASERWAGVQQGITSAREENLLGEGPDHLDDTEIILEGVHNFANKYLVYPPECIKWCAYCLIK